MKLTTRRLGQTAVGNFCTLEDLGGVLIAGAPADIVRESATYEAAGADHIVYDLRLALTTGTRRSICWGKKCCRRCARKNSKE